jgi:hypothetical protein
MKKVNITKLLAATTQFEQLVSHGQQASAQAGDIYDALVAAGNLGLKRGGDGVVWDVNSPTADAIFGLFEKMRFKGTANVSVSVDPRKKATVSVQTAPTNPNVSSALARMLTPSVQAAVMKMTNAPTDVVTATNIITAQNA